MKRKREIASRVSDTIYILPNPNYHFLNNQSDVFATAQIVGMISTCCVVKAQAARLLFSMQMFAAKLLIPAAGQPRPAQTVF